MAIFKSRTSKEGMSNTDSVYNNIHYVGGLQSNPKSNLYNYNNVNTYQCTYYALGRSGEIAGEPVQTFSIAPNPNVIHRLFQASGFEDAKYWYDRALWDKSTNKLQPKVGAIVCYSKYPNDGGGGHVQIIEKIEGTTIYLSQNQNAYSDNFLIAIDINSLSSSGSKAFIGYIYNPYIDGEEPPTPTVKKKEDIELGNSITIKALEVLMGKYGNGFIRKKKLGADYCDVQYQVNYLIHKYSLYELLAFQIMVGLWGNGRTRKRKLEEKGYNYYQAQAYVNMYKDKNVL